MFAAPTQYLFGGLAILVAMAGYTGLLDRRFDTASLAWALYLLAVSIWEEWVFRLALPVVGARLGIDFGVALVASNLFFGALHYFTLRWKWRWCVLVFFGGMGLSRHFAEHQDLAMIVAFHWVATYLNTPRLPGRQRE